MDDAARQLACHTRGCLSWAIPGSGYGHLEAKPWTTTNTACRAAKTALVAPIWRVTSPWTDAVENLGTIYHYAYDATGNRTDVVLNGVLDTHQEFDAANQVLS